MKDESHKIEGAMRWLIALCLACVVALMSFAAGWFSRDSLEETNAAELDNQNSGEIEGGVWDYNASY